jgi:rubrerythrin
MRASHLDFLIAGYDTSGQLESTVAELAIANAAMTDDHTAMCAGMARTAHHEDFEETAGWFATVAKAGRSHAGEMRRGLDNMR